MRYIWMIFASLLVLMVAVLPRLSRPDRAGTTPPAPATPVALATSRTAAAPYAARADSIVAFGLAKRGTPYAWAGTSPLTGFDCSGFIMYTFAHFGVPVPHSTALLIDVGRPVARADAQPGDIVVFTGTAPASTTAGHAGIVISGRGELPLRFVHASSSRREPFVKVNQVENSDYERRFMQVRRVLGPGTGIAAVHRPAAPAPRAAAPVVTLPARPVAIVTAAPPVAKLPNVLPLRKPTSQPDAKRKVTTARTRTKKPVAVRKPAVRSKAKVRPASKAPAKKPAAKSSTRTPIGRK